MQRKFELISILLFSFCLIFIYSLPVTTLSDYRKAVRVLSYFFLLCGLFGFVFLQKKMKSKSSTSPLTNENTSENLKENGFTFFVITVYSIHFLYIQNSHWTTFFLGDMDYVSMAEVLNNTLKGSFFATNYHGQIENSNYLSHHFSPAIILLAPFLYLNEFRLGYGFSLLLVNILGVISLSRYLLLKNIKGAGFFFLITFFSLNLYVYRLFQSYHFEQMFFSFCILLFWSIEKGKKIPTLIIFALCLLIKEDIAVYMSIFGFFLIFNGQKKIGSTFFLISIIYFLLFVPWIQSSIQSGAKMNWLQDWSNWGSTIPEIAINLATSPGKLLSTFIQKKSVIFEVSLSLGFLFYFYPKIFLILIPIFIFHFSSARIWFNEFYNYYCYTILPFLIYGSIAGYKKIEASLSQLKMNIYPLLFLLLGISLFRSSNDGIFPIKPDPINEKKFRTAIEAISLIPKNSRVNAQFDISGLVKRTNQVFPMTMEPKDYLIFNFQGGFSPYISIHELEELYLKLTQQGKYKTIFNRDGIVVIQKI